MGMCACVACSTKETAEPAAAGERGLIMLDKAMNVRAYIEKRKEKE